MKDKLCFVTTGATAPFTELIKAVLSEDSLNALIENKVTHLFIQFGAAEEIFETSAKAARQYLAQQGKEKQLEVDGMDFDSSGLVEQFKLVQQTEGLAISHAGKLAIGFPVMQLSYAIFNSYTLFCGISLAH